MKKVLVTGATGFIGNHVVRELLQQGVEVVATSRNEERAKLFEWYSRVQYVPFDMNATEDNINCFELFDEPSAVLHLAWDGLPDYKSLRHIEEYLPVHYRFLKNLVTNGCTDVTVTGTCFEYGMKEGCLSESTPAEPSNPYGLAKYVLFLFLQQLHQINSFSLKWARLFYMYGPGQHPRSLFSQLEKAIAAHETTFNMSGGEQVRDFLPVERVAAYLVKIALQSRTAGVINCCSGQPQSVKQLVSDYLAERNSDIQLNLGYYPYPDYEPMKFWGDNTKLQSIINE